MNKEVYVIWQSDIKDYGILGVTETEELAKKICKKYTDSWCTPIYEKCNIFSEKDLENEFSFIVEALKGNIKNGSITAEQIYGETEHNFVTEYIDGIWNSTKEYLRVVVKAKCMEEAIEKATKLFEKYEKN